VSGGGARPSPGPVAVVLDHTALLALGAGNLWLSGLVVSAGGSAGAQVCAPALCLSAAVAERPPLADHIGGLPSITVLDLTFADARLTGHLIAEGTDWRQAHAIAASRPSAEWPTGMVVVTSQPQAYAGHNEMRLIPLA
jgi:hypothetical protein